jgi:hypothetical protein
MFSVRRHLCGLFAVIWFIVTFVLIRRIFHPSWDTLLESRDAAACRVQNVEGALHEGPSILESWKFLNKLAS